MTQELKVELGVRSYPIHFVSNADAAIKPALSELERGHQPSVLLTDEGVVRAQAGFIAKTFGGLPRLTVGEGEAAKSLPVFGHVQDFLAANKVTRQGMLWVL